MKLLRDVLRLRVPRSPAGARRDARVREFVVTVPAPLAGRAQSASEMPTVAVTTVGLPPQLSARAA